MTASPFQKILVAYDGSEHARKALQIAIQLAAATGAELHSISVEEDLPKYVATVGEFEEVKRKRDEYFEQLTTEARAMAWEQGVSLQTHVRVGHEVETIIRFCLTTHPRWVATNSKQAKACYMGCALRVES
jgi:nucleotide-binding universal stress UspA family protein